MTNLQKVLQTCDAIAAGKWDVKLHTTPGLKRRLVNALGVALRRLQQPENDFWVPILEHGISNHKSGISKAK